MPQLSAFTRMLWAANHSVDDFTVSLNQVRLPLQWFESFADLAFGPMERRCRRRAPHSVLITFDGSLTGGGATLQAGVTQYNTAHQQPYVAYWHDEWTSAELELLQVIRDDPAGQARLEAWTMLCSIVVWKDILRKADGGLAVMGDALGVLHGAQKFKSNDAVLNLIMAEAALILAPMGRDLRAVHLWTQRNITCDRLSRLQKSPADITELQGVTRSIRHIPECKVLSSRRC